jgi:hypothetical protein
MELSLWPPAPAARLRESGAARRVSRSVVEHCCLEADPRARLISRRLSKIAHSDTPPTAPPGLLPGMDTSSQRVAAALSRMQERDELRLRAGARSQLVRCGLVWRRALGTRFPGEGGVGWPSERLRARSACESFEEWCDRAEEAVAVGGGGQRIEVGHGAIGRERWPADPGGARQAARAAQHVGF